MWYASYMTTYLRNIDNFMASTGLEAYRVGGSVRDEILGRRSKDADYVVCHSPLTNIVDSIKLTDARAKITPLKLRDGRQVGVRFAKPGMGLVEVVMPRTERKVESTSGTIRGQGNERHAFEIVCDPDVSLQEDATRRDFTFNALYKSVRGEHVNGWGDRPYGDMGIIDPTGRGVADLERGLVRTTHESSFRDDPLRTLRALRFVSVLGFDLSDEALGQMVKHSSAVTGLTGKGVSGTALDELCKLLMGRHVAKALRLARDSGVLAVLLPELADMIGHDQQNSHHEFSTDEHTFTALDAAAGLDCSLRVRMALLFHDSGKPAVEWIGDDGYKHYFEAKNQPGSKDHEVEGAERARKALGRLNAERPMRRDVPLLIERHMVPLSLKVKPSKVRKWRTDLGDDLLADLFKHRLCDVMGKGVVDYDSLRAIARLEEIREDAVRAKVPSKVSDLPITGHDLMALGLEGRAIGEVQKALLHEVVSQPDRNDRDWLLGRAAKLAAKK